MRRSIISLACLAALAAHAQQQAPRDASAAASDSRFDQRLVAADRDGDAMISREEANAYLPRLAPVFDRLDTNADGKLSAEEMATSADERRARMAGDQQQGFAKADLDGDGALDLAEAQVGMPLVAEHFMRLDVDHDGKVTPDELSRRGR
jgi:hypothetical protein